VSEAKAWRVICEWGALKIRSREWMIGEIYRKMEEYAVKNNARLESFRVIGDREDMFNRYIKIEAVISGSPIPVTVIVGIISLVTAVVYVLGIWLAGKVIIEPIIENPLPIIAVGLIAVAAIYLLRRRD